jgi:tetratricopeptide (TPR) repeat protein
LLPALGLYVSLGVMAKRKVPAPSAGSEIWQRELEGALVVARDQGKPLHVLFTRSDVPLAQAMDETLAVEPVRQIAQAHFINLRLDARSQSELFRRFTGSAGALASCIVDLDARGQLDVVAVLPGYQDADRYAMFLDSAVKTLPKLRKLRDGPGTDPAQRLELGELYAEQGSATRARAVFEELTATAAQAAALEHLARLDVEAGRIAQARTELTEARALGSAQNLPRMLLTEALILSSERRVSDAVTLLTQALPAMNPGNERLRSLLLLGQLEHELKHDDRALISLEAVQRESPHSVFSRAADELILHIKNPELDHVH